MGTEQDRKNFVLAVEKACRIARVFNDHGVRKYGVIRIDSADSVEHWAEDPQGNTARIAETFREAGRVAADHGERLAAEGEICWGGMHSWKYMLQLLESVDMPNVVGFQADLAHTYLYLLGYNAPEHALLGDQYTEEEFWAAYQTMTDALRPWTIDFHVAQNDGSVHGSGDHDKTGRPGRRTGRKTGHRALLRILVAGRGRTGDATHLLGWLHVPQCDAGESADLEHDPSNDGPGSQRPRLGFRQSVIRDHDLRLPDDHRRVG